MEDKYKIYCKFNEKAEPLTDVMCRSYMDFLGRTKKEEKNLEIPRHNNKQRDKI